MGSTTTTKERERNVGKKKRLLFNSWNTSKTKENRQRRKAFLFVQASYSSIKYTVQVLGPSNFSMDGMDNKINNYTLTFVTN